MKWPTIYHLPYSPGITDEDEVLESVKCFRGKEVVITEKLDGECTSLHSRKTHARSEDSSHHDSRAWVKRLHGMINWLVPEPIQIAGENMYAKHSIYYPRLTSFFYQFAVIDKERLLVLSFDETLEWCDRLCLEHAPILYRGIFPEEFVVPRHSQFADEIEGYVVRLADEFPFPVPGADFTDSIAKWVRPGHVKTGPFWMKNWTPNKLADGVVDPLHLLPKKLQERYSRV